MTKTATEVKLEKAEKLLEDLCDTLFQNIDLNDEYFKREIALAILDKWENVKYMSEKIRSLSTMNKYYLYGNINQHTLHVDIEPEDKLEL